MKPETHRRWPPTLMALAVVAAAPAPAGFQRFESVLTPIDIYAIPAGNQQPLSLHEIYEIIGREGLPIKEAKDDMRSADIAYGRFRATLLPAMSLTANAADSSQSQFYPSYDDPNRQLLTTRTLAKGMGLGVTGSLPYGVTYGLTEFPMFTRSDPVGIDAAPPGDTTATLEFQLGVELLKGSYFLDGNTALVKAEQTRRVAALALKATTLATLLQGQQAFFALVNKELTLRVLQNIAAQAKGLLDDIQEQFKLGEIDRFSVVQAELQAAQADSDVLQDESDLEAARASLRQLLAMNEDEFAKRRLDLTDLKVVPPPQPMPITEALALARKTRPDLLQAELNKRNSELDLSVARHNLLPDLKASYQADGTGADRHTAEPALERAERAQQRATTIALTMNYTLVNDLSTYDLRSAIVSVHRAGLSLQEIENQLERDIKSFRAAVDLGYRHLQMSGKTRELAERKIAAEFLKFKLGESSLKNVLDTQKDLNTARLDEVTVKTQLLLAEAQLRNALGLLPEGLTYDPTRL